MVRSIFAAALAALAASATVHAAPLETRQAATDINVVILQYALTLEHLEATFYKEALAKYDAKAFAAAGYPQWVRKRVSEIGTHEQSHVSFLSTALSGLGQTPTAACSYNFPYNSVSGFLGLAQVLEGVGVAAYLGAAKNITVPDYVTAAGSILTVEARHNAWIRSAVNKGDAFPEPYDTPLGFNEVYSLAAQFITSCPSTNPTLPVKAFPALTLETAGKLKPGQTITLKTSATGGQFAIFLSELGQTAVAWSASNPSVQIPDNTYGQLYVVLTSSNATVTDDNVVAGPAIVEVNLSPSETFNL